MQFLGITLVVFVCVCCTKTGNNENSLSYDSSATIVHTPQIVRNTADILALPAMNNGWRIAEMHITELDNDETVQKYIQEFMTIHRLDLDSNFTYTSWEPTFRYKGTWEYQADNNRLLLLKPQIHLVDTLFVEKFTADTLQVQVPVTVGANRIMEYRTYVPI
jgi:VCBS repeat-containing protein